MKVKLFFVLIAFATFFNNAEAQSHPQRNGISPREARILRHQKKALATNRAIAKADGRISPVEKRILKKERRKMHRRAMRMRRN